MESNNAITAMGMKIKLTNVIRAKRAF